MFELPGVIGSERWKDKHRGSGRDWSIQRLEKEFDWGREGVEIGWFKVEGRDAGGVTEFS